MKRPTASTRCERCAAAGSLVLYGSELQRQVTIEPTEQPGGLPGGSERSGPRHGSEDEASHEGSRGTNATG